MWELSGGAGFAIAAGTALVVTLIATPLARRLAVRTEFYDHPAGYKRHARATPYLGGVAVVAGFVVGTAAPGRELAHLLALVLCVLALHAIGTFDDRRWLPVAPRLAAQAGAAVVLWATGWGWDALGSSVADLALTVAWVVAVVNGFNLMDNIDGASTAVASASGAGAAALALINDEPAAAIAALAVTGACVGFLPYNLARPSRIFLGDGGSMPIGLVVAATVMSISSPSLGWAAPIVLTLVVGLVALDTALVLVSRRRRGAKLLRGARDHLTHRLLARLGSERRVAVVLALSQAALCGLAVGLCELDRAVAVEATVAAAALALVLIAVLESPRLAPVPGGRSA